MFHAPSGDPEAPLQLLMTTLGRDDYKGRIAIGRVYNGTVTAGSGNYAYSTRRRNEKTSIDVSYDL